MWNGALVGDEPKTGTWPRRAAALELLGSTHLTPARRANRGDCVRIRNTEGHVEFSRGEPPICGES
jgi:hypothetical protein